MPTLWRMWRLQMASSSYSEQIKYKQKQVTDNLTRIGKIELPEISPILGSEKTQFYRNKLEYTFSNKRWLTEEEIKQNVVYEQMNAVGFHIPNAFDKVLAIEKCWLQDDISNRIRNAVRDMLTNTIILSSTSHTGRHVAQHDHPHIYHRRINGYPHS